MTLDFFFWMGARGRQLYTQQTCGRIMNILPTVTGSQSEFVWLNRQPWSFRSENSGSQSASLHLALYWCMWGSPGSITAARRAQGRESQPLRELSSHFRVQFQKSLGGVHFQTLKITYPFCFCPSLSSSFPSKQWCLTCGAFHQVQIDNQQEIVYYYFLNCLSWPLELVS